jgi:DNA-binding NarL/FixJ family response regulator
MPSAVALADRAEAEAARAAGDHAIDAWRAAVESADAANLVYAAAAARVRYAEAALVARGSREPAIAAIHAARDAAEGLGAMPLLDAILELARRARVDMAATAGPAPAPRPEAGGARPTTTLSERELEVLRLVALGRSNGQIADELFITRKTASSHVTHILDKLGVSNRLEAAMMASRLGLLPRVEDDEA